MTQEPHPVPDEDPERHIGEPVPDPWGELETEHDRLMNERARLVLDGADPADLVMPLSPPRDGA